MAIPVILRGDATAARNRSINLRLPEADYSGITLVFHFLGVRKSFADPASGDLLAVDFTADETAAMALGTHFAHIEAIGANGKYIIGDGLRIKVTDTAAEAYGVENTIDLLTSSPSQGGAQLPDLSDINSNPQTPEETKNAFVALLNRLKSVTALSVAFLAFGFAANAEELQVYSTRSGALPYSANVVTNVAIVPGAIQTAVSNTVTKSFVENLGIEAGLQEEAVRGIAENVAREKADVTVNNGDGSGYTLDGAGLRVLFNAPLQADVSVTDNSGAVVIVHRLSEKANKADLANKLDKAKKELHADSRTNIVWQTCYENGWVFLRAYTNDLEVAE